MKKKTIGLLIMLFVCLAFSGSAFAYSLFVQTEDLNSNAKTSFAAGEEFLLQIKVDNHSGIAGCAFTLNYPSDVFLAPATTTDGTPAVEYDITSVFPFSFTHDQTTTETHRENSMAGKILFSGAAINTANGGPLYTTAIENELFTIKFKVKESAPAGCFNFSISQSQLLNPSAGWGIDTNSDGIKDAAEPVPVLVGAVDNQHTNWNILTLAYPILLGDLINPFSQVSHQVCVGCDPSTYEGWKDCNGWDQVGVEDFDYDRDGYSNFQEFENGTDPTAQNALGGTGYNSATDNRISHYPPVTSTPVWMDIYGTIVNGSNQPIADGDEIAVYVDNGQGGLIQVGFGIYSENVPESYGPIHVYGDDTTTTQKDGAEEGDTLILKSYDFGWETEHPLTLVSGENSWSQGVQKELNWKYRTKQRIPLHKGWNLISFSVNKCFHVGNRPTVDMIDGVEYVQISSINDILSTISGQYSYVRGFDSSGAKSYNLTPFSDLKYMAAGYGYWIKVKDDAAVDANGLIYLDLEGDAVLGTTTIPLHEGWNLVGYFGNKIQYKQAAPVVHFPEDCVMNLLPSGNVADIFSSIAGKYSYVRAFDETGAKSYNLTPFSDLKYVGPGYGYWIKVNVGEAPNLIWED